MCYFPLIGAELAESFPREGGSESGATDLRPKNDEVLIITGIASFLLPVLFLVVIRLMK